MMEKKNKPNCPHSLSRYLQAVAYAEFLASPDPNSLQQHAERWLLPAAHPRCAAGELPLAMKRSLTENDVQPTWS